MLKIQATILLAVILAASILSCGRIKRKGHQVIDTTKVAAREKKENLMDRIIPRFDATTPDTRFNKQRFHEFFEFYPTSDVKNLYCYGDQIGIDASYWFGFECNDSTAKKVISKLQLTPDRQYVVMYDLEGNVLDSIPASGNRLWGGLNSDPTPWWDTAFIFKSVPYGKQKGTIYWYLWHDTVNKKVYFLTFDT